MVDGCNLFVWMLFLVAKRGRLIPDFGLVHRVESEVPVLLCSIEDSFAFKNQKVRPNQTLDDLLLQVTKCI